MGDRFELRTKASDLQQWRGAAVAAGYSTLSEWVRGLLTKEAERTITTATQNTGLRPQPMFGKTVLENGVRVVTEALPGVRSIAIGVFVDCGSKDESVEQSGIAHLCEHLLFQGTSARDAMQVARQIDSSGGQVGGFTSRDYTCYFASILDDYRFHALDLLGDMLLNSTFPEHSVQREKRAILGEIERCWDMPEQRVHDLAKRKTWSGHALGRSISGDAESIAKHTREDVIYFLHRHYTPNRIIIAGAGHLDHNDFVAQARDSFWRLLGDSDPVAPEPPAFHPGVTIESTSSAQAYFCLLIPAAPYADAKRYGMHVLNRILGGGISSRLFRKLREEAGLVYEIQSDYHAYRDAGVISIEGSTSAEQVEEVISTILETMSNLFSWSEPVTTEELWRSKIQIRTQHLISSEDAHTRMCRLATQELYFGRYLDADHVLAEIDAVDVNCIEGLAKSDLLPRLSKAHVVIAGPIRHEAELHSSLAGRLEKLARKGDAEPLMAGLSEMVGTYVDTTVDAARLEACATSLAGVAAGDRQLATRAGYCKTGVKGGE